MAAHPEVEQEGEEEVASGHQEVEESSGGLEGEEGRVEPV